MKKVVIIGSGFASLSAAAFMAKAGWEVAVLEKHAIPGGRARQLKEDGFTFDMGPSWYWMPGVFDRFFDCFSKKVADYYTLERLDPSYRVYWPDHVSDIPADYNLLKALLKKWSRAAEKCLINFSVKQLISTKWALASWCINPVAQFLNLQTGNW